MLGGSGGCVDKSVVGGIEAVVNCSQDSVDLNTGRELVTADVCINS